MILLLTLCSCMSDALLASTAPRPGPISGRVVFDDGTPAAGAEVATTGSSAITDEDGAFELPDLPPDAHTPIRVHPSGGTAGSKFVAVDEGETTHTTLRVMALQRAQLGDAAGGGTVATEGGLELTFAAGSLVTEAGTPVTGTVDIDYALLNTFESMTHAPGNQLALDDAGGTSLLVSNGMAEVSLSQGGRPVQLAKNALISFPTMGVAEMCDEPFGPYGFDPELSVWVAAGEGSSEDERFVASVPHLSSWNCDATVSYLGCADAVRTLDGHPLVNQEVGVWLRDYSRQIVTSDAAGAIRIQVPQGRTVSVLAVYDAARTDAEPCGTPLDGSSGGTDVGETGETGGGC
ncbi:MAG: carboxypeptidase regulatory-like domain-containing protein [Myxococcales bacterium]|nr:carboxypeptidase regulatory-like domain-containing protein [Myxococcales bacterium]